MAALRPDLDRRNSELVIKNDGESQRANYPTRPTSLSKHCIIPHDRLSKCLGEC